MRQWKRAAAATIALCLCAGVWGCAKKQAVSQQSSDRAESYSTADITTIETTTTFQPEVIDAFSDLQVTFTGTYPQSSVQYSGGVDFIEYTISKEEGVKNGDVVTVTASLSDEYSEDFVLEEVSKDYTVDGLAAYVMNLSELPEDMAAKLEQQSQDIIASDAADWQEEATLASAEFLGYYFLSGKEGFSSYGSNCIYCVYRVNANIENCYYIPDNADNCNGTQSYFTFVKYDNLMLLADGTSSVNLSNGRLTNNYYESDWERYLTFFNDPLSFNGYGDLDSMFNDCVTSQIDAFSYENTVVVPEE